MIRPQHVAALALVAATFAGAGSAAAAEGREVRVGGPDELRRAAASAKPGDRILLAGGEWRGGLHLDGLRGTAKAPVVLAPADPKDPPVIRGGGSGLHLTDPEHVEVRGLVIEGATGNGLNIDDGGTPDTPARGVVVFGVTVRDVGPRGNCDAIKLSGLVDFRIDGCTLERWGDGGSGIDMVGCRRGTIEACTLRHTESMPGASGVQAKGATRDVTIRANRFEHAGGRAVNAGGSTGLEFFRPPLAEWKEPRFEAKDLVVEGNTIVGSQAPVACVGLDGGTIRFNTIVRPGRWTLRILQETRAQGFVPCRNVTFSDNVVVFRSDAWSEGGVNRGDGTEPDTFAFARNVWFCEDAPARTRDLVRPPTPEKDGTYGRDPAFRDAARGDFTVKPGSPAAKAGAHALPR